VGGYGRQRSDNTNTRGFNPDGTRNHNKETLNYTQSELRLRQMLFDGFNTANEVGRTEAVANSRAYYTQATAETVALRHRGLPRSAQAPRTGDPGQEQPAGPPAGQ
jgi:adhesin transport system outer membrane protein